MGKIGDSVPAVVTVTVASLEVRSARSWAVRESSASDATGVAALVATSTSASESEVASVATGTSSRLAAT